MPSMDALQTALSNRRTKNLDPSLINLGSSNDPSAQISKAQSSGPDVRDGFMSGNSGNSPAGSVGIGKKDAAHPGIDAKLGVDGSASAKGEAPGGKGSNNPTQYDWRSPDHADQHTSPRGEDLSSKTSTPYDWRNQDHGDQNTPAVSQGARGGQGNPLPASQSSGMGAGDLASDMRDAISGHASQNEYDQLKNIKPTSLGMRAKMAALQSKYSPAGNGKSG